MTLHHTYWEHIIVAVYSYQKDIVMAINVNNTNTAIKKT
jgi:hypothetical protein